MSSTRVEGRPPHPLYVVASCQSHFVVSQGSGPGRDAGGCRACLALVPGSRTCGRSQPPPSCRSWTQSPHVSASARQPASPGTAKLCERAPASPKPPSQRGTASAACLPRARLLRGASGTDLALRRTRKVSLSSSRESLRRHPELPQQPLFPPFAALASSIPERRGAAPKDYVPDYLNLWRLRPPFSGAKTCPLKNILINTLPKRRHIKNEVKIGTLSIYMTVMTDNVIWIRFINTFGKSDLTNTLGKC